MSNKQINNVLIIGSGQGGLQTAVSLRQGGFQGSITLLGDENSLPYQRPPLSKAYLTGKADRNSLSLRPEKFFADHNITLIHDQAVTIDRTNGRVGLGTGVTLDYDHLVLATGARNRTLPVPGADLKGVFGLRTIDDADAIAPYLETSRHVVVIGAGFIGLEFAAVANARGLSVHVVDIADRPMARAVTPDTAAFFRQHHEKAGITFDFQEGLRQIKGEQGRVSAVETTDGRILPADLIVFGIGVLPNIQLAAQAGLDIENGIRTDSYLLTSDPAISAVGDVASFPNSHTDTLTRLESVQNAVDQARNVAARLNGNAEPYTALPWFWTEQADLKLQIAGMLSGYDIAIMTGDPEHAQFSVLCFRRGRLVAVESVNRMADYMAARRLLAGQTKLSPDDAAQPGFTLKNWNT